jgi:hypothetical protein
LEDKTGRGNRLVFHPHRLGEREHIVLVIFVVAVAAIDFEAARRGRSEKNIIGSGDRACDVDLFLQLGLADISNRTGAGLDGTFLRDLRAGRIEQRAALGCIFVEVGKFLAVLAALDQRFFVADRYFSEAAEPVLHVAQPVATLGIFALVDDIDPDLALPRDNRRDIVGELRLVADRDATIERQKRQTADVGRQDLRDAALHCARLFRR